jgi:hypothetical protein
MGESLPDNPRTVTNGPALLRVIGITARGMVSSLRDDRHAEAQPLPRGPDRHRSANREGAVLSARQLERTSIVSERPWGAGCVFHLGQACSVVWVGGEVAAEASGSARQYPATTRQGTARITLG